MDPYRNHTGRPRKFQADHTHSPLDIQLGKMKTTQFGGDLSCPALDYDPPWESSAESDLRRALLATHHPQTSWIAESHSSIFDLHVRHRPLEAGLVQFSHSLT